MLPAGLSTTCAFCFRTSAGVVIRQATSSPEEDARAWVSGVGMWFVMGKRVHSGFLGLGLRVDFMVS